MWAKQSIAATLIVGPILDSTGAEYTSAVIGDLSISKNGGTLTALAAAATLTHIANGQYTLVMTTGNLDTLGRAQITCNKSTYQMPPIGLVVVPAMVFDSLVLGTDVLQGDTVQFAGQTITAAADVTIPSSIASPTNIIAATGIVLSGVTHTGAVIPTVTTVTNQLSAATISTQVTADLAVAHGAGSWATATGFSTHSAADVWSVGTRTITGGSLTTSPPTAAVIADAVWDEARSGHVTEGTFGEKVVTELDSATAAKIDSILEDTGTTLPAAIAAIEGGGSGTGARTVTITVNDGTTALQNATVRMTEGANTFTALTNASGVAVFNLDDATYTVGITKSGYSYAGTTLIVNGTETATYSMTLVSVTSPTNPDLSAIEVLCLGADFTASSGIDIDFRMAVIPSSDQNNAFPGAKVTVTSNVSGIARWEAPQGAAIEYKRGRADVWTRVTLDSDSVTNVTSVIGSP